MTENGNSKTPVHPDCSPTFRSVDEADVAKLLRGLYECTTVEIEWDESPDEMNVRAVKNCLRQNRLLLFAALKAFGFRDYNEALEAIGSLMTPEFVR